MSKYPFDDIEECEDVDHEDIDIGDLFQFDIHSTPQSGIDGVAENNDIHFDHTPQNTLHLHPPSGNNDPGGDGCDIMVIL